MTLTDARTSDALTALLVAAPALLAAVPGADGWTVEPFEPGSGSAPAPGSRAVVAELGEAASAVVVVDPDLARHLQVGPPPADDLLEGAGPLLAAAAQAVGLPVVTAPTEVDPSAAAAGQGVTLLEAGRPRASVVVVLPVPAPVAADPAGPAPIASVPAPVRREGGARTGLELLHDVEMAVTAELGRTRLLVREVLDLAPGSVIELDRAAGSPVDVLVNGTLIARGEVVVIDEEFGIRISEVVGYEEAPAQVG